MTFSYAHAGTRYKVYFTPKISDDDYGDEVDVSDRVDVKGLPTIKVNLDSSDYDIGKFTYADLQLKCQNSDGFFNESNDPRSMFRYLRDFAKVHVVFFQDVDIATITYRGLINDEATKLDVAKNEITFRVLSRDSVLNKSDIESGTITDGMMASDALFVLLNVDSIVRVLTVSAANISVKNDIAIDDGSAFDDLEKFDAIKQLLLATNSVMYVNEDDAIIISNRNELTTKEPFRLFGQGDLRGRENIVTIQNYNTGLHRVFNIISVNNRITRDDTSILTFGARKKEITFDWMTNTTTIDDVAADLLDEFKYPKLELEVTVETFLAKEYTLLDRVKIDYPLRAHPSSAFLPICGAFEVGDTDYKLPFIVGSIAISPTVAFKIIDKSENTQNFMSTLKVRQVGTETNDGYFT